MTSATFRGRSIPTYVLAVFSCKTHLFEKSRVVVQEREEIKYHILYQLLGVADNGCAYGTAVVGHIGWQRPGKSLSPNWTCWKSGGDAVVKNYKPT